MKEEVAKAWVAALRGGKYEQAEGALRAGSGFCCLGVLCDISKQGEWRQGDDHHPQTYLEQRTYLPAQVQLWAEVRGEDPYTSTKETLSALNDRGLSFEEIADIIEQHWRDL